MWRAFAALGIFRENVFPSRILWGVAKRLQAFSTYAGSMEGMGRMTRKETELLAGQPVSIASVARRAGVSIATVSRVINGVANKASPATIAKVREAVAALDYRPSSAGKSLRQKQSRLVAVLAANMANPTMAAIAASAEIALRERGLVMVLCDTHDRAELQDEYLREMRSQQARAIVLLGAVRSPLLDSFRAGPTPLVFVNRVDPGAADSRFVGIDNAAAGRDVSLHAIARGLLKPAVIHAPLTSSATRARVEAILATYAAAGHPIPAERQLGPPAEVHLRIGFQAVTQLAESGIACDACLCTGDLIAFGAHRAMVERPAQFGRMAFYGFDDNPLNDWIAPWLTSVRIPYDAYGTAIVDLIVDEDTAASAQRILRYSLVHRMG
jgi:LacI family transcriptional regulator